MAGIKSLGLLLVQAAVLLYAFYEGVWIRLHAVRKFGRVIHEFDPWFNYRATEYYVQHGWKALFSWFDDQVWYPLGRPVGTTIYPGLQITSGLVYQVLTALGFSVTVNDVCVFQPAGFCIVSIFFIWLLSRETIRSRTAALVTALIFAISSAHLMRSVAGGYDNESIAIGAMLMVFFFWTRSIRDAGSWVYGFPLALAYIYMAMAWGGYVFVVNMVGLHAGFLTVTGRHSTQLHRAYTIFYVIGTYGATLVPVIGTTPLRSLEQMMPLAVFLLLQVRELTLRRPAIKSQVYTGAVLAVAIAFAYASSIGYLAPLSARVRGLFVQHTRTGNPLVDSVAEHQATSPEAFWFYLHITYYLSPLALPVILFDWWRGRCSDAKLFLLAYWVVAFYFASKMNRLILLLGPPSALLSGWVVGTGVDFVLGELLRLVVPGSEAVAGSDAPNKKKSAGGGAAASASASPAKAPKLGSSAPLNDLAAFLDRFGKDLWLRRCVALGLAMLLFAMATSFYARSHLMAPALSQASIILEARYPDGRTVIIDDFREAYHWLRDNTPQDSRVLAWWDYGYQINGIANRTSIADGNTWNHEHIALLGSILVSPVKKSHEMARHLADYVLVWSTRYGGSSGDDIAKSPHMARIASSVYRDVIDPATFFPDRNGQPSQSMRQSTVYTLVTNGMEPGAPSIPPGTYEPVLTTTHRMVRIYKVLDVDQNSKRFGADGHGKRAWLAGNVDLVRAYPPALRPIVSRKQDFAQLEDFNKKGKLI